MTDKTQGPTPDGAPDSKTTIRTGDVLQPPSKLVVGAATPATGLTPLRLISDPIPSGVEVVTPERVRPVGDACDRPGPAQAPAPRRRVYECTRAHASTMATVLAQASTVVAAQGEDADKVARFKYAAGRNLGRFQRLTEETDRLYYEGGPTPPPRRDEFFEKFKAMMESYAERDPETKAPIYHQDGSPKIIGDNVEKAKVEREALEAQYPEIRAWGLAREAYRRDLAYEIVAVPVHTFPFDRLPQLLSGGYISDLSFMLYGDAVDTPAGVALCHYCGEEFPADTEDSALALSAHLAKCTKHPMRQLEASLATVRAYLASVLAEHAPGWEHPTEGNIPAQVAMGLRPAAPVELPPAKG